MDDLLDLDWDKGSAATQKSTQYARPSAATSSYNFDALTRSLPTSGPSGSQSSATLHPQRKLTPVSAQTQKQDAFSSLFDFPSNSAGTGSSTPASGSRSTRATTPSDGRAAPAVTTAAARNATLAEQRATSSTNPSWQGWDAFETVSTSLKGPASASGAGVGRDASGAAEGPIVGQPTHRMASPAARSAGRSSTVAKEPVKRSLLDFDDFEDPGDSQTSAFDVPDDSQNRSGSPASGPRWAALEPEEAEADVDILGDLGKPVSATKPRRQEATSSAPPSRQRRVPPATDRVSSPPPHLVGQLVEMGFAPAQAKQALLATDSGLDVQVALEALISAQGSEGGGSHARDRDLAMRLQNDEARDVELEAYEAKEERRRMARGGQGRSHTAKRVSPEDGTSERSAASGEEGTDWQKQADMLYAQASELGANVFSRANAFWTQAKQQAQKTLEEQASGSSSRGRGTPVQGSSPATAASSNAVAWARKLAQGNPEKKREWQAGDKPRWMVEAEEAEAVQPTSKDGPTPRGPAAGAFKDSDDEDAPEEPDSAPYRRKTNGSEASSVGAKGADALFPQPSTSSHKDAAVVPSSDQRRQDQPASQAPAAYVSSARWGRKKPAATPAPTQPPSGPGAIARRDRSLCQEDRGAFPAAAAALKTKGNDHFKNGNYGDAEASYTAALDLLPSASLRRLPLLNNRANTRLKNGDASAASRDCSAALTIVLGEEGSGGSDEIYRPSRENTLPPPLVGEVDLRDAYAKALLRRAQAYEMLERYIPALRDWEKLEKYEREEGSGVASSVRNLRTSRGGIDRCRGAMKGSNIKAVATKSPPAGASSTPLRSRPSASAAAAIRKAEEAGRDRVRAAAAAQSAEEIEAHSLKDSIDARIGAWKAGKETNIRALLSSLDLVVWEGLGWKKVGMHEVLTDPQIKKVYTKAIARLHPDKLTPARTTLEERLLGNAIFSVLNDAYAGSQRA
ncbi:unnamed protein product [Parajaminaea phylloscopi]